MNYSFNLCTQPIQIQNVENLKDVYCDIGLDVSDHADPGVKTNCDVNSQVFERDQILTVDSEHHLSKIRVSINIWG